MNPMFSAHLSRFGMFRRESNDPRGSQMIREERYFEFDVAIEGELGSRFFMFYYFSFGELRSGEAAPVPT